MQRLTQRNRFLFNRFIPLISVFLLAGMLTGCSAVSDGNTASESTLRGESSVGSAVHGVWLTNVDSKVLNSKEGIKEAVAFCKELGLNAIFPVVWNKGVTLYPSAVMKERFGIEIDSNFKGRDPLRELTAAARENGIKVIPWFEFGFAASYKSNGGHLLAKMPNWKAIDKNGELVTKNGFEWMNGFDPEVQDFVLSLIEEVVTNYAVDGIQGDDRLPAMPSESGYDPYTVGLYKSAHNGEEPPADHQNPGWLQFRADLMTDFAGKIYRKVKSVNPAAIVAFAPSVYPFSKTEYLQDWVKWVKLGYVDLISPQVYRKDIDAYTKTLKKDFLEHLPAGNKLKFYPGILLNVGSYKTDPDLLLQMVEENRKLGIMGEIYFFYEGLKNYTDLFREEIYPYKVSFPNLTR
ncbi:MAG: family 10 glycosylhydrolase [Ignavibacteriales bacterium]|nr:family 10 glycosylhydrolase [Ignavibacteriales bacterium]WKZ73027.1 MAG: family 10 glycosylhydrolase [Ignavibacteriaceae bacterium]